MEQEVLSDQTIETIDNQEAQAIGAIIIPYSGTEGGELDIPIQDKPPVSTFMESIIP